MNHNRRHFFKQLALGAAAFTILPAAETYSRIWKPKAIVPVRYEINPAWVNAEYELSFWWHSSGIGSDKGLLLKRRPFEPPLDKGVACPVRFTVEDGTFIQVPAFAPV